MGRHDKERRQAYRVRQRRKEELRLRGLKVAQKDGPIQVDSTATRSHTLSSSTSGASYLFPRNSPLVIKKYDKKAEHEMTDEEYELEKERQATLVFESLPKELQECFEHQNIVELQNAKAAMEEKDATYHMKRCVESGLWVPDAKKADEKAEAKAAAAAEKGKGED